MFRANLLIFAQTQKLATCPSVGKWVNNASNNGMLFLVFKKGKKDKKKKKPTQKPKSS
jgi:hypothetical protein